MVSSVASVHGFSQPISKHLLKFVFEADFGLIVKVEKNEPLVVTFSSGLYYNIVRRQLTSPSITSHISPLIRDLNFQSI